MRNINGLNIFSLPKISLLIVFHVVMSLSACSSNIKSVQNHSVDNPTADDFKNTHYLDTNLFFLETDFGDIHFVLYDDVSLETVAEFKRLIQNGYYKNGMILESKHQLGFVITKTGADRKELRHKNEKNSLKSKRGSIGVMRSERSAVYLNKIFVSYAARPQLESQYIIIGEVVHGLDAIEKAGSITKNNVKLIINKKI
jgi:cyclophilin family peptidyl-prolyl cis-trans isomerase